MSRNVGLYLAKQLKGGVACRVLSDVYLLLCYQCTCVILHNKRGYKVIAASDCDFSQLSANNGYPYTTYTYTHTYYNNNAVLEELLSKLACRRHDLSAEELEEHLSSY